ncbi:MAG: hypothetical protein WKF91_09680 [Segetibacter sp.]
MYNCSVRSFAKYLRENNYTPEVKGNVLFLNEWYLQFKDDTDYITVSHPHVFPLSLSFPFCDFDKVLSKLYGFVQFCKKFKSMYPYKSLKN